MVPIMTGIPTRQRHAQNEITGKPCGGVIYFVKRETPIRFHRSQLTGGSRGYTSKTYYLCSECRLGADAFV